jgi:peptidoglycan/LPS O-acetylase OafA/YrhL
MQIQKSQAEGQRILFLDFLRIFAFASVLIGHLFYTELLGESDNPLQHDTVKFALNLLLPFFHAGAGVTVFFLVSGYIITHILQTEQPLEFIIKRVFRIYPLYMFAVLMTYVIAWESPNWSLLVPQLLLIGDLFNTPYALAGVEWTLRAEMMFYAIMFLVKTTGLMEGGQRALPWVFLLIIVLVNHFAPFPSWGLYSKASYSIALQFLFLGAVIYLKEKNRVSIWFLLLFGGFVFYHFFHLTRLYAPHLLSDHYAALALLVFIGVWSFRRSWVPNRYILILSNLTYAVYLFHLPADTVWDLIVAKYFPSLTHSAYDLILIGVIVVVSFVMTKFIEMPLNKIGHRLASRYSASSKSF